jgi:hypothetical protein
MKQSISHYVEPWIVSRSLSSGARSRDPLARNDGTHDDAATFCGCSAGIIAKPL